MGSTIHDARTPDRAHERGTSLIELMIGTVVLIAVIAPIITLNVQNSRLRALDGEMGLAFAACRNALEDVRALPFAAVPDIDGDGFAVPGPDGGATGLHVLDGDADGLPGEFTVITEDAVGGEVLYRVRASVRWTGMLGPQQLDLDTLIANRGSL